MNKALIILLVAGVLAAYFLLKQPQQTVQQASEETEQTANQDQVDVLSENCPENFTVRQTEGPYYKANSPQRNSLIENGVQGDKVILSGYVFDQNCKPIPNLWLDFWQADVNGNYDNEGFKLRGHQFTDSNGKYTLATVIPGEYPGRTPHIHVKLRANENSEIITSQLYFPDSSRNTTDTIFDSDLLVDLSSDRQTANYNFKIDVE